MNDLINTLLLIALAITLNNSVTAEVGEKKIAEQPKNFEIERQEDPILSRNYEVAKKALEKASLKKDKVTIRRGLKAFSIEIKKQVVQSIIQLNDKTFVPDLIEALQNNQTPMSGGTETAFLQQELNKAIISALRKFTKLSFSYLKDESTVPCFSECPSKDIQKVVDESKAWLERRARRSQ